MIRRVAAAACGQTCGNQVVSSCKSEQGRQQPALWMTPERARGYSASATTLTRISTTTSVCAATDTVCSPTVFSGPVGMRICDF